MPEHLLNHERVHTRRLRPGREQVTEVMNPRVFRAADRFRQFHQLTSHPPFRDLTAIARQVNRDFFLLPFVRIGIGRHEFAQAQFYAASESIGDIGEAAGLRSPRNCFAVETDESGRSIPDQRSEKR